MAEITREDAIICFKEMLCDGCSLKDSGIARCCELAEKKAISDMEKLEQIEKLFEPHEFGAFPYSYEDIGREVKKIVKGE